MERILNIIGLTTISNLNKKVAKKEDEIKSEILESCYDNDIRRNGNTTRIIDKAIQVLFKTGSVKLTDHHPTRQATVSAFRTLLWRLDKEHNVSEKNINIIQQRDYIYVELLGNK